jgi:predicted RNA-binding Zn ribbon-like protein
MTFTARCAEFAFSTLDDVANKRFVAISGEIRELLASIRALGAGVEAWFEPTEVFETLASLQGGGMKRNADALEIFLGACHVSEAWRLHELDPSLSLLIGNVRGVARDMAKLDHSALERIIDELSSSC